MGLRDIISMLNMMNTMNIMNMINDASIRYVVHQWYKVIDIEMPLSSLRNPDTYLDFWDECLNCEKFNVCYPEMLVGKLWMS